MPCGIPDFESGALNRTMRSLRAETRGLPQAAMGSIAYVRCCLNAPGGREFEGAGEEQSRGGGEVTRRPARPVTTFRRERYWPAPSGGP